MKTILSLAMLATMLLNVNAQNVQFDNSFNINGYSSSGTIAGSITDGDINLSSTALSTQIGNVLDNGVGNLIVTLYCPVTTSPNNLTAPGLGSIFGSNYTRSASITIDGTTLINITGSASLTSYFGSQTITGTVPSDFLLAHSNVMFTSPLSFLVEKVSNQSVKYSGSFSVLLDGVPHNISVVSTYSYTGGVALPKNQYFNILSPSLVFTEGILNISQTTQMSY